MKKKIIFSAYNVHQGGGKVLLESLIHELAEKIDSDSVLFIDTRLPLTTSFPFKVQKVAPTIWGRLGAEWKIRNLGKEHSILFCFGNLPPLFSSRANVSIFLQNKYLISKNFICWTNLRTALRTAFEKVWFELRKSKKYTYLVQTASMKNEFLKNQGPGFNCRVAGFAPRVKNSPKKQSLKNFIYIASGEPHKNHKNLILAWKELKARGLTPSLTLVLDDSSFPQLTSWIREFQSQSKLEINIISRPSREQVMELYSSHEALIFPSTLESFGLPLIEAQQLGLKIVASELDFVRDVVLPDHTFDPHSPVSIARAVERQLNISSSHEILMPSEFLDYLTNQK